MSQNFDYFLVLDFEATCDEERKLPFNEIIEFPTCAVNAVTKRVEFEFHQYVKPTKHQELTNFCHDLTGIKQEWVDNAKLLRDVLQDYEQWLTETKLIEKNIIWITCGDWDLRKMLPSQCKREKIPIPEWVTKFGYINIKKSFCDHFKVEARGMANMLRVLDIVLEGRHHSGIDDSRNTAKILVRMMDEGYKMTTVFHDISITGQYVRVDEGVGSVCISSWFPNHGHMNKFSDRYGRATMIVTCMNKREGSRRVNKFLSKYEESLIHVSVSYPGPNLLKHDEVSDNIQTVYDHLREKEDNKVIVTCQNGYGKSTIFLYLLLRKLGKESDESIKIIRNSRYRSIENFHEENISECEEFLKR